MWVTASCSFKVFFKSSFLIFRSWISSWYSSISHSIILLSIPSKLAHKFRINSSQTLKSKFSPQFFNNSPFLFTLTPKTKKYPNMIQKPIEKNNELSRPIKDYNLYLHFQTWIKYLATHDQNIKNRHKKSDKKCSLLIIQKSIPESSRERQGKIFFGDEISPEENFAFTEKFHITKEGTEQSSFPPYVVENLIWINKNLGAILNPAKKMWYILPKLVEIVTKLGQVYSEICPGDLQIQVQLQRNSDYQMIKGLFWINEEYQDDPAAQVENFVLNLRRAWLCLIHYFIIILKKSVSLYQRDMDQDLYEETITKSKVPEVSKILFMRTWKPFLILKASDIMDQNNKDLTSGWDLKDCTLPTDAEIFDYGSLLSSIYDCFLKLKPIIRSRDFFLMLFSGNGSRWDHFLDEIQNILLRSTPTSILQCPYYLVLKILDCLTSSCHLPIQNLEYFEQKIFNSLCTHLEKLTLDCKKCF